MKGAKTLPPPNPNNELSAASKLDIKIQRKNLMLFEKAEGAPKICASDCGLSSDSPSPSISQKVGLKIQKGRQSEFINGILKARQKGGEVT